MATPFLKIRNAHAKDCGAPPMVTNQNSDQYIGYFEGRCGDQWLFLFDRKTKTGTLQGGDAGWDDVYPVEEGNCPSLVLSKEEALWLQACWAAAAD